MIHLPITGFVSVLFSPLLSLNPALAIFILSTIISFLVTLPYRFLIHHEKMKEIKERVNALNERAKEEQKNGNTEKANELMMEVMKLQGQMMKHMSKPLLLGWIVVFIFLPWISQQYGHVTILLPFSLPIIGNVFPFNWMGWYFVTSYTMTKIFRVILGVEI